jgi:flagellar biogenesis protein FliO
MNDARTRRMARAVYGLVAAGVIVLTAGTALADDPPRPWLAQPPNAAPAPAAAPQASSLPWRSSLMIGVSAALGAAAVWVRSRKGGLAKLTSSRELRVISSVRVGPKGHLVLAGIGDRALLLGVTDASVRRIAWLPADSIAAAATDLAPGLDATGASEVASTALVLANDAGGRVRESGPAPAHKAASRTSKGAFADMLRKIGGRYVDTPPAGVKDMSPAATLAELRRDSVQWSKNVTNAAAPSASAPGSSSRSDDTVAELEQQAAGILKHRSRRRV